jgi:hypothetical protein
MADGAEHFGATRADGPGIAELLDPVALEARLAEARARRAVALARRAADAAAPAIPPLTADARPARRHPAPSARQWRRPLAFALALTLATAAGLAALRLPLLRAEPPEAATALLAVLTPLPPPVAVAAATGAQPTVAPQLVPPLHPAAPEPPPPSLAGAPAVLPPAFAASKARGAPGRAALSAVFAAGRSLARPEIARLAGGGATALAEAFPLPPKPAAAPRASARARQGAAARPDNPIAAIGRLLARARRSLAQPPSRQDRADRPAHGLRDALGRQGWPTSAPDPRSPGTSGRIDEESRAPAPGSPADDPATPVDGPSRAERGPSSPGGPPDAGRGGPSRGHGSSRDNNGNHGNGNNGNHGNGNHGGGNNGNGNGGRDR